MLQVLGLFDPVAKECVEMYYQYDHDYRFHSDKFQRTFGLHPTPYREALLAIRQRLAGPATTGMAVPEPG